MSLNDSFHQPVMIDEGFIGELEVWRQAYGFSNRWQVEKALRFAYSFPEKVFNVKENNFLKPEKK